MLPFRKHILHVRGIKDASFYNICVFGLRVERRLRHHMLKTGPSADRLNFFHLAVNADTKHLLFFSNFPTLMMWWTLENPECHRGQPDLPMKSTGRLTFRSTVCVCECVRIVGLCCGLISFSFVSF